VAAVGGGDRADDGQAETGAAGGAGAVGLEAAEGLEQGVDLGGGDRGAGVGDPDHGLGAGAAGVDLDPAAGLVVADGVLDQVGDQPLQQGAVAGHRGRAQHPADPQAEPLDLGSGQLEGVGGGHSQVDGKPMFLY